MTITKSSDLSPEETFHSFGHWTYVFLISVYSVICDIMWAKVQTNDVSNDVQTILCLIVQKSLKEELLVICLYGRCLPTLTNMEDVIFVLD